MEPRLSMVTLGVADVSRARSFYERLGWTASSRSQDEITFFQVGALVVGLWGRAALAADSGAVDAGGWGGVTLAHNVRSPAEVDAVLAEAAAAGGTIARPGEQTFWGGYSGVFVDPDGHPWEVAVNPQWKLDAAGNVTLP